MNICVIGTCRVCESLDSIGHKSACGLSGQFVHNSSEVIQRINFLKGKQFEQSIKKYIFRSPISKDINKKLNFSKIDAFVIEISSKKIISYKNYFLQLVKMSEVVKKASNNKFKSFNHIHSHMKKVGKNSDSTKGIPNSLLSLIFESEIKKQTYEMLESDVAKIIKLINRPILFVNHINVKNKKDGALLDERDDLSKSMNKLSKKLGFKIFNPNKFINDKNRSKILLKAGTDINHYSNYGKKIIARNILDEIKKI
tara:strand:- start:12523 stop:13287 length:765 start_codon:yes stop_codon:yes gene_type:complete